MNTEYVLETVMKRNMFMTKVPPNELSINKSCEQAKPTVTKSKLLPFWEAYILRKRSETRTQGIILPLPESGGVVAGVGGDSCRNWDEVDYLENYSMVWKLSKDDIQFYVFTIVVVIDLDMNIS